MTIEEEVKQIQEIVPTQQNSLGQNSQSMRLSNILQNLMNARSEYNNRLRELFGKILEGYLQLPHKLKPIFDRSKKYESQIGKFYKADPALLYDLTQEMIE